MLATVTIPAGAYTIGTTTPPPLVQPPQRGFIKTPTRAAHTVTLEAFRISTQLVRDKATGDILRVTAEEATALAHALGGRLPTPDEWEAAARGPEAFYYPWGNTTKREDLTLERETYSVDESSTMGYYDYSEEVFFIESFGPYAGTPSPFGLHDVVRIGQEWNAGGIQRSLTDLGGMTIMIPGKRPRTWDSGGMLARQANAYSGPSLVHYTADPFITTAAFRVVYPA